MTLLLGPPSSGKTTLLLALAGRLGSNLQVCGLYFLTCYVFCYILLLSVSEDVIVSWSEVLC